MTMATLEPIIETGAICLLCEHKIDDHQNGCYHCVAEKIHWAVKHRDEVYLSRSREIQKQTATLRAEKKELYRALKTLVDNGGIGPEAMFDVARAALAKARGGR